MRNKIVTIILLSIIMLGIIILTSYPRKTDNKPTIAFPLKVIEATAQTINGSEWTLPRNRTVFIIETTVNCPFSTPKELYDNVVSNFADTGTGYMTSDGAVFNKTINVLLAKLYYGYYIKIVDPGKTCTIYSWVWNVSGTDSVSDIVYNERIGPLYVLAYNKYSSFGYSDWETMYNDSINNVVTVDSVYAPSGSTTVEIYGFYDSGTWNGDYSRTFYVSTVGYKGGIVSTRSSVATHIWSGGYYSYGNIVRDGETVKSGSGTFVLRYSFFMNENNYTSIGVNGHYYTNSLENTEYENVVVVLLFK